MARAPLAPDDRLFTQREVAQRLGVGLRTVERARADGQLEVVRLGRTGRSIRITARSVERYITARLEDRHISRPVLRRVS